MALRGWAVSSGKPFGSRDGLSAMTALLHRLYLLTRRHAWLYPAYLLLRVPVIIPVLLRNEGFCGALSWLGRRVGFLLKNRHLYGSREFYQQPIAPFRSRQGFVLSHPVDYLIYDEIFLTRCYAFARFPQIVRGARLVLDFGTHHGMFMDYVRTFSPEAVFYGAEMNPESFAIAQRRFAAIPQIHLSNVAIGGIPRRQTIGLVPMSIEQRLDAGPAGGETREVEVITPTEFLRRWRLDGQSIDLLKMDIEGAEREVFDHFESIQPVLEWTRGVVMEIHTEADAVGITGQLAASGFQLQERRGINFFYLRHPLP
jgi:FkbM family methyltransferase